MPGRPYVGHCDSVSVAWLTIVGARTFFENGFAYSGLSVEKQGLGPNCGPNPLGTPRDIITRLNRDAVAILTAPANRERITADGAEVLTAGTPKTVAEIERVCAESPRLPRSL